jgi:hypothetical protein
MRQARHETETERIAVRKEHYWNSTDRVLRGQGAQGAPDGDRVRTEAVKIGHRRTRRSRGYLNYGRPSSQELAMGLSMRYSMIRSACPGNDGGIARLSAFAGFR